MLQAEVVETEGLLDWVKEKLGIGYTRIGIFTQQRELDEIRKLLTAAGIRNYVRCRKGICELYVEEDKALRANTIIDRFRKRGRLRELPATAALGPNLTTIVLVALAVPLLALLILQSGKK